MLRRYGGHQPLQPYWHGHHHWRRQRFYASSPKDQGRRSHPHRHRQSQEHQQALGKELPRVPVLRQPDRGGLRRRSGTGCGGKCRPGTARSCSRHTPARDSLAGRVKGRRLGSQANVLPMVKRLDPTFDPKDHGYTSFSEMLKALDAVVEIKKGEKDHLFRLR
ncbi:hypothetical protein BN2476_240044 [Paraburkholderia piptadeniae]|uniref:HTH OST-type domain-containing protein n=1 Tax=Paraburkholderia piptadeniae TaxID=1701573 RepID=A0A1N7RYL0_9BURK|nr:hypothetical protein BN2476_240044 [Paraburkholderia piptadeniae]